MNGENIKKIYVVNLDNKRIILLMGSFILLISLSFLIGLKSDFKNKHIIIPASESMGESLNSDTNQVLASANASKENNVLVLPEEDTRIFEKHESQTRDDSFLGDPPERSVIKKMALPPQKNTVVKERVKKENSETTLEKLEKYYTIQIGAYVHEKDAISYQARLKKKDIESRIDHGKMYYFVRAGKSADKESLQPLLKKINNTLKLQAIVVQRKIS